MEGSILNATVIVNTVITAIAAPGSVGRQIVSCHSLLLRWGVRVVLMVAGETSGRSIY